MHTLGEDAERVHCAGCGEVVGLYEPAWVERADGTLHPSSLLNLDAQERREAIRVWHAGCVIDDFPPPA